jgi:transposase-like protein
MNGQCNPPSTLTEAIRHYSDPQVCVDAVAALRWPDGNPVCPKCGTVQGERKHYWLKTQRRWKCFECRRQFSVKVGTIFEDSPLGLDVWMTALWMLCNCRNGVSSYEIARATGIAQKSAWHLLQRLRLVLKDMREVMLGEDGPVEIDEVFVGPNPQRMHASRRLKMQTAITQRTHKVPVMGMLDRNTRQVRAQVVPNVKRETLQNAILENLQSGATVYTDQYTGYDKLAANKFVHETVNHMETYVSGQVHTQGIENFWSLLKRGLRGTYIAVEPFHLERYVDEQVFRYNNRIGHTDATTVPEGAGAGCWKAAHLE